MEHRAYPRARELANHTLSLVDVRKQDVIHVRVMNAMRRHDRSSQDAFLLEVGECLVIALPDCKPSRRQLLGSFELRPQEGRDDIAGKERRSQIHPRVLVDLSPKEG